MALTSASACEAGATGGEMLAAGPHQVTCHSRLIKRGLPRRRGAQSGESGSLFDGFYGLSPAVGGSLPDTEEGLSESGQLLPPGVCHGL
ncbi:hypothetical protein FKM82_029257 [Ascaphus truei]